jgi:hypothetical protein
MKEPYYYVEISVIRIDGRKYIQEIVRFHPPSMEPLTPSLHAPVTNNVHTPLRSAFQRNMSKSSVQTLMIQSQRSLNIPRDEKLDNAFPPVIGGLTVQPVGFPQS